MTSWIFPALLINFQAILYHALPRLSRPEFFFGVTVDSHYLDSPHARAVLTRYRIVQWLAAMAAAAVLLLTNSPDKRLAAALGLPSAVQSFGPSRGCGKAHGRRLDAELRQLAQLAFPGCRRVAAVT